MAERMEGEVIHVVTPSEREAYDLDTELQRLAESRYILVCRKGGAPSWIERIYAFLTRTPIEAVTIVSESEVPEGQELTATVQQTELVGVYEATEIQ